MSDEEKKVEEVEGETSYYDEIRADIETAVYAFTSLEEVDTGLFGKIMQNNISKAKKDCVYIICKGLKAIKEGYEEKWEEED